MRRSIEYAASRSPFSGYVVRSHFCLRAPRDGIVEHEPFRREQATQLRLTGLGTKYNRRDRDRFVAYLGFCDLLSLHLCSGWHTDFELRLAHPAHPSSKDAKSIPISIQGGRLHLEGIPERLELARSLGAITVDYSEEDVSVPTALEDLTGGIGPDSCIDAVGLEAHSAQLQGAYDKIKVALMMETDRPGVLRQAIQAVRKGGTPSIPGVYGGLLDKVPFGAAFGKGITMKMGQTNMHNYMKPLLQRIEKGQIDPSYIISHRITLDEAPEMYKVWRDKQENVTKIVIDPWAEVAA
jgi:hypothetical protein